MSRRAFVGGITSLCASTAGLALLSSACGLVPAPMPARIPRIGYLSPVSRESTAVNVDAFVGGLRDLGYIEGQTIAIDWRFPLVGGEARLPELAADLVRQRVDVIVAQATLASQAARQATSAIPIVGVVVGEPLQTGLVANLARPDANVTALSSFAPGFGSKWLDLLREVVPNMTRVAVFVEPANTSMMAEWAAIRTAGQQVGVRTDEIDLQSPDDVAAAFEAAAASRADALIVDAVPLLAPVYRRVGELAIEYRRPGIGPNRDSVAAGLLMSYGPDAPAVFRRAAVYVDKILKGAKPADLPVEQPTVWDLVVNTRTLQTIGLTIPASAPGDGVDPVNRRRFLDFLAAGAAFGTASGCGIIPSALGQRQHMARIGVVISQINTTGLANVAAFRARLGELGWKEGDNVAIEVRAPEQPPGPDDQSTILPILDDFVRAKVDVIVAASTPVTLAAKGSTSTTSIVARAGDMLAAGIVTSLARPGANLTGVSESLTSVATKQVELFKQAVPSVSRLAVLWYPDVASLQYWLDAVLAAAAVLGVEARRFEARVLADLPIAFDSAVQWGANGIIVEQSPPFTTDPGTADVVAFAAKWGLPAMYPLRAGVAAGGLMAYGIDQFESWRIMAQQVAKVLGGANPGDLPVEQPTRFYLALNQTTLASLGLALPQTVALQVTEWIR